MEKEKKDRAQVRKALVMVSQVGISMLTPILLCALAGYWIDKKCGTSIWFIILLVLGIFAAFRNVYVMMVRFYEKDLLKEKKQQMYEKELREHSKKYGTENIDDLKVRRMKNRDGR